jgi:hypothetical protein
MLGRKTYTRQEIDQGRAAVDEQLAAYRQLAEAATGAGSARASFDPLFFNNMVLVLDRYFVHRFSGPKWEGKDGNPLNELRIICDSIMSHGAIVRADKQIKLPPERSVLGLAVGDRIALSETQFERLSEAFFTELEARFLEPAEAA